MAFHSEDHRQIILGTLLGNAYLCQNVKKPYLCIRHSERHLPWLQSKAAELEAYQGAKPWHEYNGTHTWRSCSTPDFADLIKLCYKNGRKMVNMEWLDQLKALAIAVWYGDSGCLTGRGNRNACLRTQSFGKSGNQVIERYFNEVGIPCNMNKSRNSWVIVFTVPGTEILMSKIVAPNLPSNRHYKLIPGEHDEENDIEIDDN